MKTKIIITAILAQVAASACMDLALLSEMIPMDAGEDPGVTDSDSDADSDGDSDSDSDGDTDGPPATDTADEIPPLIITGACGVTEQMDEQGICVAVGPTSASFRFATHEPAQVTVTTPSFLPSVILTAEWADEHHIVVAGLPEGEAVDVTIGMSDVNTNFDDSVVQVTGAGGPAVSITEVLADPLGAEPDQEFVEVVNFGAEPVDVSGWMIDDNGDADGDLLPDGTVLGPGAVMVVVANTFDPTAGEDPSPAAGCAVVYLDSSIASSGLKNSEAETIELYDSVGNLVSWYDGCVGNPKEGKSAWRVLAEAPDDDEAAWGLTTLDPPTPGQAPTIM